MAKVYVTRCIVKKDGKMYRKGSVIDGLTSDEIRRGLAEYWLEKVGNDDEPKEVAAVTPEKKKRDRLLAKAEDAGIEVTDEMTNEEIEEKLGEAYKRKNLLVKAEKAGVTVTDEMTNEEIQKLIAEAKAAK